MPPHAFHGDMTVEQHNAVMKLLRHQYKQIYNTSLEDLLFSDEQLSGPEDIVPLSSVGVHTDGAEQPEQGAEPVPSVEVVPDPVPVPDAVAPQVASQVAPPHVAPPAPTIDVSDTDMACMIADTQHGNHKFMCLSFPNEHAFESATVLLQISVLRSGDISVRTRMRIMRSVQGDVFHNVPALCGPVYHITAAKHVSKESSKDLVLPHAIRSMFCIYALLITKLRLEAVKRGILAPDYRGHKFDKLRVSRRAEMAFDVNPLPELEAGVSVFNEDQFDFVKPVNAALTQLNTMWDFKPQPGVSRKRAAVDLSKTDVKEARREAAHVERSDDEEVSGLE